MKRDPLRNTAPRSTARVMARPRPTLAAAMLLATLLSLPLAVLAVVQAAL